MKYRKSIQRVFVSAFIGLLSSGQSVPVPDETALPIYFENLRYPLAARLSRVQGVVIVQAKLDIAGKVASATALSGPKSLVNECLLNVKRWRFRPNSNNLVIIVYQFRIEGLCNLPCTSHFVFFPPNLAYTTMGEPVVDHSAQE